MPATLTPPPAAAPAAPKAPAGVAPPSAGEIHITAPTTTGNEGNPTIPPPKADSAKGKMFSKLREKAGVPDAPPAAPAKPKGAAAAPAGPETARPGAEPNPVPDPQAPPSDPEPGDPPAPGAPGAPAGTPEDRKKVSPWKLVDQFKDRATKAEARALELEKQVMPEAKRKEAEERLTKYEARIKEMEDDLRYHNAEKYDPDILKANADYEGAWKRAFTELSEIPVIDLATREPRAITTQDIAELVNLPLGQARELAKAAFGDFADDAMAHRKEIKTIFEAKMAKLEELKKNGADREKQRKEQFEKLHGELSNQIKTAWERESAAALADEKHGKFFKAREGDADWNERIEKGYAWVDKALNDNPSDPKLTPEERAQIIRRHVALKNRAAAFPALRLDLERTQAKLAELEKKLAGYESSTPGVGGTVSAGTAPVTGNAREQFMGKLRALAK